MNVLNPEDVQSFACNKIIADYIISKNILPISHADGKYYFADTIVIRDVLFYAPWYIKILLGFTK